MPLLEPYSPPHDYDITTERPYEFQRQQQQQQRLLTQHDVTHVTIGNLPLLTETIMYRTETPPSPPIEEYTDDDIENGYLECMIADCLFNFLCRCD